MSGRIEDVRRIVARDDRLAWRGMRPQMIHAIAQEYQYSLTQNQIKQAIKRESARAIIDSSF